MRAFQAWSPDVKCIEFGASSRPVGDLLVQAGFDNYLNVAASEAERRAICNQYALLADRVAVAKSRKAVRHNNADVLVLGPSSARATLRFRNLRHAQSVALTFRLDLRFVVAVAFCLCHVLVRRLDSPNWVRLSAEGGRKATLLVFRVRKHRLPKCARHWIPHRLGIGGFLKQITDRGIRHAVLRWFDALPEIPAGEDLDILVADNDLEQVFAILSTGPGIQACDVYSETGLPRSDFRGMPYFPPALAGGLLERSQNHNNLCHVPAPRDHFLSLVYHALFHKGPSSGLPERSGAARTAGPVEHDYPEILRQLAARLAIDVEITRDGLDQFVVAQGWLPPRDMLTRLAKKNRWIRQRLANEPAKTDEPNLVVFILRQEGMNRGGLGKIIPLLEQAGFSILKSKVFYEAEVAHVAGNIRGGNWGRGPWSRSGGRPAAVIVAYDPHPKPLSWRQKRRFPLADNARVLEKTTIRNAFNAGYSEADHCNVLHSSDNGIEAWEYIATAMPEADGEIRRLLVAWRERYRTGHLAVRDLTRYGVRAKVERIDYQGRFAVRKTFKPGRERFCRREELAMRELSRTVREIPPLLESQENSVTYPFYDDVLKYKRSSGRLIPLDVASRAIAALERVYEAGYALVDASIDNVLVDRREGLKLFDFEFLHRYDSPPASFSKSFDVIGCPDDFSGDLPKGGGKNYRRHWLPYVGLSLESLQNDPRWLQHLKRSWYVVSHAHRYYPRRVRRVFQLGTHFAKTVWNGLTPRHAVSRATPPEGESSLRGPARVPAAPAVSKSPAVGHPLRNF